jgi:hypothetical protein
VTDRGISTNGISIRLTDERWAHIMEEHSEMAELRPEVLKAINFPLGIVEGGDGELLAYRELELGKYIVVVYRELEVDGFVITAFATRRLRSLERKKRLWP